MGALQAAHVVLVHGTSASIEDPTYYYYYAHSGAVQAVDRTAAHVTGQEPLEIYGDHVVLSYITFTSSAQPDVLLPRRVQSLFIGSPVISISIS